MRCKLWQLLLIICSLPLCFCVHKSGVWNSDDHVHTVVRFGVRQLDLINSKSTKGFIYGNITVGDASVKVDDKNRAALFIVPESQIKTVLTDSSYAPSCDTMLRNISQMAYESKCLTSGKRSDLLRWVPCIEGKLCEEEDRPELVVSGSQFTFRVEEPVSPEFWYVLLMQCTLNENCSWVSSSRNYPISYDIWLVNGNPEIGGNTFSRQFSFEEQEIIHIYTVALFIYIILALCQLRAASLNRHNKLPQRQRFLNYVIGLKTVALVLQSTDAFFYAFYGKSTYVLMFVGEILRVGAVCTLCLLLVLLARGWSLNRAASKAYNNRVHYIWSFISLIHLILFTYSFIVSTPEVKSNSYDFLSNRAIVALRLVQGLWFLVEIKRTIKRETDDDRAIFLVHFGAAYMVWFVYFLGLGAIAAFISELWRLKVVLAISTFANFVAIACLVHIFWPTGSNRKFFAVDGNCHRHLDRTSSTELEEYEKMLIAHDTDDSDDNEEP